MKKLGIAICALIVPPLLLVNTIRHEKGEDNITLANTIEIVSEAEIGFPETYVMVARAGTTWKQLWDYSNENSWLDVIGSFFNAIWTSVQVPFYAVGEFCETAMSALNMVFQFIGDPTNGEDYFNPGINGVAGGGFGGGGGRGT